jgi:ketosteroid isomerase-like protein
MSKPGATAVETDDYRENMLSRTTKTTEVLCGTAVSSWVRTDDGRWLITNQTWTTKPCSAMPAP